MPTHPTIWRANQQTHTTTQIHPFVPILPHAHGCRLSAVKCYRDHFDASDGIEMTVQQQTATSQETTRLLCTSLSSLPQTNGNVSCLGREPHRVVRSFCAAGHSVSRLACLRWQRLKKQNTNTATQTETQEEMRSAHVSVRI